MFIKQLSVFVENRPGRLAGITKVLADNDIDIRALSIADTTNFGILRLIVDNPDKAEEVLRNSGYTVSITSVIAIGVEDRPGGLYKALEALYNEGIAVEYMYAFVGGPYRQAFVILRVEENERAANALSKSGIRMLSDQEVCRA